MGLRKFNACGVVHRSPVIMVYTCGVAHRSPVIMVYSCGVGVCHGVAERRRRSICVTAGETRSIGVPHALNPEVGSTLTCGVGLCGFVALITDFVIFISDFDISLSE
jgi:hypothetical protein